MIRTLRPTILSGTVVVAGLLASSVVVAAGADPRIELVALPSTTGGTLPVIPWVEAGADAWSVAAPLFEMPLEGAGAARGRAAVTAEDILIKIAIEDEHHVNTREGGDIWDGDAIQLGIDARGDGVGALERDVSVLGPDDASITFALTEQGPRVWAHYHGRPGGEGELPASLVHIVRDEDAELTTYEIRLPWAELQSVAGVAPTLGLAVQINDQDETESHRSYWGRGAGGAIRPGLFNQLAVAPPPSGYAAAMAARSEVWRATGAGEVVLVVVSNQPRTVRARLGSLSEELEIPGSPEPRRFAVRGYPGALPVDPIPFAVSLDGAEGVGAEVELTAPGRVLDDLAARVDAFVGPSTPPLLALHLRSIEAVVRAEWNRASVLFETNPEVARSDVAHVEQILKGLEGDAGQWEPYAAGRRDLAIAFVSGRDRTLQFYRLHLPPNRDPERAYPLIVSLHGAGDPHPLGHLAGPGFAEPLPPAEEGSAPLEAYVLSPWGRGNLGYRGIAETDVFEAIGDATRRFRTDPDRHSLTGHSMGGGGTWSLGIRTPDLWAALCIVSGGTWGAPVGVGLGGNLAGVPVRIWHGDSDNAVPVSQAYAMDRELREHGMPPEMRIIPGQGHGYPAEAQRENLEWLLQHERRRPESFSFIADTPEHRGRNGVELARDSGVGPAPRFTCRIEGQTVEIDAEGTDALSVVLGEGGLGLEGDVTVNLNGRRAYEGPVKTLNLDIQEEEQS